MNTSITTHSNSIIVKGPYNTDFIERARRYGGKWSGGAWQFDILIEKQVRDLCVEVYGTDGISTDLCNIEVTISDEHYRSQGPIELNGRIIAKATGRDSGATIGDGVTVLQGGFKSGGSSKNWATCVNGGGAKIIFATSRGKQRRNTLGMTLISKY